MTKDIYIHMDVIVTTNDFIGMAKVAYSGENEELGAMLEDCLRQDPRFAVLAIGAVIFYADSKGMDLGQFQKEYVKKYKKMK